MLDCGVPLDTCCKDGSKRMPFFFQHGQRFDGGQRRLLSDDQPSARPRQDDDDDDDDEKTKPGRSGKTGVYFTTELLRASGLVPYLATSS